MAESVAHDDCQAWNVASVDETARGAVTLLVPFDRPRWLRRNLVPRVVGRRRWVAALRALLASTFEHGHLRAAASAKIDLLPYQLEPALTCLEGAARILIADEVGLGKTIQAGLIIAELAARTEACRVLVLAPAGLCGQWRRELEHRFHLQPIVIDASALRSLARWPSLEAGPWQRVSLAIASLDFVKRPEVLRGMAPARYDLLVVDEAHTCARARDRSAAVRWLGRRSRRVVLLTATPDDGDPAGLETLQGMGGLEGDAPLATFRRTRSMLGPAVPRRVRLLRLRLSSHEAALHAALERYTSRVWRAREGDAGGHRARLAMVVLRKRAASGPTALMLSLSRRLDWLSRAESEQARQLQLPLGPETDIDDEDAQPDGVLAARGLDDVDAERRALRKLVESARQAAAGDAKIAALRRLLGRAREPAIVFTEYRDTLDRLATAFEGFGPVALLHGGMTTAERDRAVHAFNEGRATILLATDAAAHGLNLQTRCRLVINVELPWNPVRLEQRIGRVDRIGQRRRVHAVNLVASGTSEDSVLAHLVARIERARRSLGSLESLLGQVGEEQVACAVFEARTVELAHERSRQPAAGSGQPVAGETDARQPFRVAAEREAARLERTRALTRTGTLSLLAQLDARAPWVTMAGRRHGCFTPGLWCVCRVSVADASGKARDRQLVLLHTHLSSRPPALSRCAMRGIVAGLRPALERAALLAARPHVASVAAAIARVAGAAATRERAMDAAEAHAPRPLQPGLFDRRALAKAERDAFDREQAARDLAARLLALEQAGRAGGERSELLLVLAVPR